MLTILRFSQLISYDDLFKYYLFRVLKPYPVVIARSLPGLLLIEFYDDERQLINLGFKYEVLSVIFGRLIICIILFNKTLFSVVLAIFLKTYCVLY